MTTSRGRGARAVRRSLDVLSVALLVAGAGAVIVVALASGHHSRVDLPVDVGVRAGGPHAGPATVLSTAERLSVVAPASVTLAVLAFTLGVLGLVLLIVRQVRALAADAAAGAPFGEQSPQRIRVIGIAIVGAELGRGLAGLASAVWVRGHVAQPGISVRLGFPLDIWVLGAGLLVVLLAEVFRMGVALQRDHDLTI
ncbi:MAG TPA: DUF2975 domain-containing protein [Streptosporangiaceae bacterium]|nr:DUF2975 domain-containing protein [Streptosporangiaceae bacterium]